MRRITREEDNETGDVRAKGRIGSHHSRQPLTENSEEPGSLLDLSV